MLEYLRNNFDLGAIAITLVVLTTLIFIVALILREKHGRPMRDTIALFGAGLILIILFMPLVIVFSGPDTSPGLSWLLKQLELVLFFGLAYLVWWSGNKLSHRIRARRTRKVASHSNHQ